MINSTLSIALTLLAQVHTPPAQPMDPLTTIAASVEYCPVGQSQGPSHPYCTGFRQFLADSIAYKPAKEQEPKPIKIAANAEGFKDTFVPKPNKPPKQTRLFRIASVPTEGVDRDPRGGLPRCKQRPCLPGSTTLFAGLPKSESLDKGPKFTIASTDRHVPGGRRGTPKGTQGGGSRAWGGIA